MHRKPPMAGTPISIASRQASSPRGCRALSRALLAAEARAELVVNPLRLRPAATRYLPLPAGCPPPTAAAVVSTPFAGIKRAPRRPLNKKTALVLDRLLAAIQAIPETLPGLRDRAL